MHDSNGSAFGESCRRIRPHIFLLFIYPEVPAPNSDCGSVSTSSDYGNRTASQTELSSLVITGVNQEALPKYAQASLFLASCTTCRHVL